MWLGSIFQIDLLKTGECLQKYRKIMPKKCKNMLFDRIQRVHESNNKNDNNNKVLSVNAGSILIAFCDQEHDKDDVQRLQRAIVFALTEYESCALMVGSERARKDVLIRVPLCVHSLKQLCNIKGAFEKDMFMDLLSSLVGTSEQPNEVLSALGEVFGKVVAPIIISQIE